MKRKAKDEYRRKVRKYRRTGEGSSYQVSRQPYVDAGLFGDAPVNLGRRRSWGEYSTDVAAGASGAALGYISGNVAGAIEGARYGNRASQLKRRKIGITLFDEQKTKESISGMSSGNYVGRITKSKSKSKSSMAVRNKYQGTGAVVITETYGYVSDPDVVGCGHVCWNYDSVLRAVGYSLLRKLFLQSGIIVETTTEIVRMIDATNSGGFILVWNVQDSDGSLTAFSYGIPPAISLEGIWIACGIQGQLESMFGSSNPQVLERIMLMSDTNRVMGQLILRQQHISLTVNAHTTMQNRTKSATADGSLESTVVDAQPIKGSVFEFSGIPKTKEITPTSLNTAYNSGVILFRRAQLAGTDVAAWAEPPTRKSFYNVVKSSYCRLAPGVLKDFQLSKTWQGNFQTVLKRFKINTENGTWMHCPGGAQVAYFEEEINSGSANKITVNYETQHTVGCKLTTTRAPNMQPSYSAGPQNNA